MIFLLKGGRTLLNIGSLLSQNARKFPEVLAIECEGRNYTYRQFNEEVNRLAHGLLEMGINKGDKIALMMKNSDHFVFTFFAIAKIGAVAVPVNFRLTSSEVHYILQQSEAKLVVCDLEFEEIITTAKDDCNVETVITIGEPRTLGYRTYESALSSDKNEPEIEVSEKDDLEILYTSGTTGRPKGALFDHKRIFNVGISVTINMGLRPHERILHVAPLFHSAQLNLFLISGVALGATHIIHRDFHPVKALQTIQEHKITHFFGVPAMFNFILQVPNAAQYDLSSIRRCG
ncbi:MAG: long-chain fatty acid--CoA ligase [Neobacillus sp.]|nr:long-chain fatty acid--CoA ligase [Neobacillus sp.]